MKNNKIILVALLIAAQSVFTSCSKDWLEVEPIGKTVTDVYYANEEEVGLGLVAAYDFLHTDGMTDAWESPYIVKNLPADDSNCGGGGTGDQFPYQQVDDFDWQSQNNRIEALYRASYLGIYRANKIINAQAEKTPLVTRMIAEARALRAYYYFDLVMCFGGVPISPEGDVSPSTPLPRQSADAIYDLIVSDLEAAASVLPNKSEYALEDRFRVSKQTALGMLVKVNVFRGNPSGAISAFEQLASFEGSEVGLEANYGNIFFAQGEFGIESLLEASFKSTQRAWAGWGVGWVRDGQDLDNRHIQLMGPRGPFNGGTSGMREGWGFLPATDKITAAFEAGDLRKVYTALSDAEFGEMFGGEIGRGHDVENSIRMKYAPWVSETVDPAIGAFEMEYSTNWRLLRYSDVLLLAAEAYNATGNDAKAREQLNKVRSRAGLSNNNASGSELLNAIKQERFVELAFEGHRYWDLVRWGDAGKEIPSFQAGKHELFPLPQTVINNNSGISEADQNPGY